MNRISTTLSGARIALAVTGAVLIGWGLFQSLTTPAPPISLGFFEWAWLFIGVTVSALTWLYLSSDKTDIQSEFPWPMVIGGYLVSARLFYLWGERAQHVLAPTGVLATGLGILTLTTAAFCDLIIRDVRSRNDPGTSDSPEETTSSPDDKPSQLVWLRTFVTKLRRPAFWVGALAAFLAFTVVAGSLLSMSFQPISTTAPGQQPYPAMPGSVSGKVAWTTVVEGAPLDEAAGTRGPLIAVENGVIALDAADGHVLWEHRRNSSKLGELGDTHSTVNPHLVTSPDGVYAAIMFDGEDVVEVLETATGRVVAHRSMWEKPGVQLTNQVAWIGDEGVRLSDGSIIWNKMHPKRDENVTSLDSKFISQTDCIRAVPCSIVMFSDSDPDDYQRVDNLIDGNRDRVNTAHGWMAQLAPRTSDPGTSKATTLQAYSLNTGQTVPLGDFDRVLHTSETRLVLARDGQVAVFDPGTATISDPMPYPEPSDGTPNSEDINDVGKAWPTGDLYTVDWRTTGGPHLALRRPGTSVDVPVELPANAPKLKDIVRATSWAAPGCVMVQNTTRQRSSVRKIDKTLLACVR